MFLYESMFPTMTQQIYYMENVYNVFKQYMLVGSWITMGNTLSYEKHWSIPICLFTIRSISLNSEQDNWSYVSNQILLDKSIWH